jgi:hypothetical protein
MDGDRLPILVDGNLDRLPLWSPYPKVDAIAMRTRAQL